MLGRPKKQVELVKAFRAPRVLTFDQLCLKLSLSRSSAFRRLKEHGYYSSYNCYGKFLTIEEVADFDAQGLWAYRTARFSRLGTLEDTVEHFVKASERGMTHEEISEILGVRAHNALLKLTGEDRVRRKLIGPSYIYFATKRPIEKEQELSRREFLRKSHQPKPSSRQVIATFLEIIKDPRVSREQIAIRCQRGGVPVPRESVDAIFEIYELDKKRAL